ncbi:MAG TPA: NAD(+) diphosphatase [Rhizobiaceae bacterium]|nr:NAD(+) diphosphatase [Rhizobiaceae bacterium]
MKLPLFDAPPREPSQFVGFAGGQVERQSENRADDAIEKALAAPDVRVLIMRGGRLLMKLKSDGSFDQNFSRAEAEGLSAKLQHAVLLGQSPNGPLLGVPGGLDPEHLPEAIKAIDYRSILMQGLLDQASTSEMALGGALLGWHSTHRFCGKCGGKTEIRGGGFKRLCTSCNTEHFPRTDPVAIMLTVKPDKCLLGRGAHFAPGSYSALAGFIEPGETIEEAVRRETLEESGIRLGRVSYHASQPWPFPYSLMIGCFGEALNEDIDFDHKELEDCRWFERAEVLDMLNGTHSGGLRTPPKQAIAHNLIRAWAESE